MVLPTPYTDRTGTKIVPKEGVVDIAVLSFEPTGQIYLIQSVLKADPTMKAAPYFITVEGLEEMAHMYETGQFSSTI